MRRLLVLLALLLPLRADAHVGSPDVFFEGDAGPYHLFVTIRVPQVIPGVATIEIRSQSAEVSAITVVPMRLTGPGSELPPAPDRAERSTADPQFFTAGLWLMEHGSMQVRIVAFGAHGEGKLAVPVPAVALRTLTMNRGLGALLFGLMLLLAISLIFIVTAAVSQAGLDPEAAAPSRRRSRIVAAIASVLMFGLLAGGNAWWNAEAEQYAQRTLRPWDIAPRVNGCQLTVQASTRLLLDHGHEMHLFLVRIPALDRLFHLHPLRPEQGEFVQTLPSLPPGRYQVFADIVLPSGFPITGVAQLDLPNLICPPLSGDDAAWSGAPLHPGETMTSDLPDGGHMMWDRPSTLDANVAMPLRFHVVDRDGKPATDLEPYMGMAAHAEIIRSDTSVFAHIHPEGSVSMPALELARAGASSMRGMPGMPGMPGMSDLQMKIAPQLSFPFGFPRGGAYRIFVQIKRAGQIQTAAFDAAINER